MRVDYWEWQTMDDRDDEKYGDLGNFMEIFLTIQILLDILHVNLVWSILKKNKILHLEHSQSSYEILIFQHFF